MGVSWPEEKAKEKAKSKADANPFENAFTIMASKAKAAESKSKIDFKKDSH